jgi:hypothetical protein
MNTPEQAGATLARDMIALVESHYTVNDERMMAMHGMMGAFIDRAENIHLDKYAHDNPRQQPKGFTMVLHVSITHHARCCDLERRTAGLKTKELVVAFEQNKT